MWLQVTKSKVWKGKDLSHTFLKQNDFNKECLLPILFKFPVECVNRNQENIKPNWIYQCQFYAHNISLLDKKMCTIKTSTEALVVTSKETGLEENAHEQNAQQNCNMKVAEKSFEMWRISNV